MISFGLLLAAPVLAHPVERGAVITESDFVEGEQGTGTPSMEQLIGREAARWMPAGKVLGPEDVVAPRLVRRGEMVTLRVGHGTLTITTAGRVLADARLGETVRVVAAASKRTLDGRAEAPGVVRIIAP